MNSPYVCGIDIASTHLACAIIADGQVVTTDLLRAMDYGVGLMERTTILYHELEDAWSRWRAAGCSPALVCLEEPPLARFNVTTVRTLSRVLGVAALVSSRRGVPTVTVNNSSWKKFLGVKGKKRDEQKASCATIVRERFPDLGDVAQDVYDAVGVALYGEAIVMPEYWRACPVCGTNIEGVRDTLACWLGHEPDLLTTRRRGEIAEALACTGPRVTQALQELGYAGRKPRPKKGA